MKKHKQFIQFATVGASNTAIALAIYYTLVLLHVHYQVANVVAFVVSSYNGYFWSSRIVFKKGKSSNSFIKFYASYGITFLMTVSFMYIFVDVLGLSKMLAPILILFVTIPVNFLLNKYWSFKVKGGEEL
ncbi:MAG: GtrA family protein [Hyphomonadaceae bacterium]|nr:GtrA family protein [Clostridia bacterium]